MFGSSILDLAIGMVFIYLLLSLVVSAANELVAGLIQARASNLEAGIRELLKQPVSPSSEGAARDLAAEFYAHPLIGVLSFGTKGRPSYIPSRTFALTVLDLIAPAKVDGARTMEDLRTGIAKLPAPMQQTVRALLDEAGFEVEKFKTQSEIWFNNGMDRVSGWYKRKTQWLQFGLALAFAFAFNVDSVRVAKSLAGTSSVLRNALVEQAEGFVKAHPAQANESDGEKQLRDTAQTLGGLGLPIGWSANPGQDWNASSPIGWLISALAASLGAPFWFDVLNRFINIRAAGRAPEEEPKEPKEMPQPQPPGHSDSEGADGGSPLA